MRSSLSSGSALSSIKTALQASRKVDAPHQTFTFGTVTAVYADGCQVQLGNETAPRIKHYQWLGDGNRPNAGDRVQLCWVAGSYVIMGKVPGQISRLGGADWTYVGFGVGSSAWSNSWNNYEPLAYAPVGWKQDAAGKVRLKGMMAGGTIGVAAFTVPPALCPDQQVMFSCPSVAGMALVAVEPSGAVAVLAYASGSSNAWVSLDDVAWFPASMKIPWVDVASTAGLAGTWTNYGNGYPNARWYLDPFGVVHWDGLIQNSSTSTGITICNLDPAAYNVLGVVSIFNTASSNGGARIDVDPTILQLSAYAYAGAGNSYLSLAGIEYFAPNTNINIVALPAASFNTGWTNYSAGSYDSFSICKDDSGLVRLRGLIAASGSSVTNMGSSPLPPGFRPGAEMRFPAICGGNLVGHINVGRDGNIHVSQYQAGATSGYISLDNVMYFAEA
jgi:hypothetical protein